MSHSSQFVDGEGPIPSRAVFIGEAPGKWEDVRGRPFVGDAGRELDGLYLADCAGIRREEVYVTNAVKRRPPGNRTPSDKEVRDYASYVAAEIRQAEPEFVVLMGATPARLIDRKVDLDVEHGIPFVGKLHDWAGGWEGWMVVTYHPARGLHEGRWMRATMQDFEVVGRMWDGERWVHEVKEEGVERRLLRGDEVRDVVRKLGDVESLVGIDTETYAGRGWSVQFSVSQSAGYMVRRDDERGLSTLGRWLTGKRVVFHHALADWETTRQLCGWRGGWEDVRDTMQAAYQLGLPQGLKALAYRLLGVRMRSYEDLVWETSRRTVSEWLAEVLSGLEPTSEVVEYVTPKKKIRKTKTVVTKHPLENDVMRVLRHTMTGDDKYDPWAAWERTREGKLLDVEKIEAEFGRMPSCGIGLVEEDEAVKYGCDDARVLTPLWDRLKSMQETIG
jgi:uracil-DNA glycosylase